jgi:hypothetical protein
MSLPKTFTAGERLFASDLNDNFNNLDGRVDTVETSGFRFAGTRYYTSDGTFDKSDPLGTGDIGLRAIRVEVMGAGGGGGGSDVNSLPASAGGGGGYARSFITDIAGLADSVNVTRGAGGTAGANNGAGGAGGVSSFGAVVSANGGSGGGAGAAQVPAVSAYSSGRSTRTTTGTGDLVIAGAGSDTTLTFTTFNVIPGANSGGSVLSPGIIGGATVTGGNGAAGAGFGVGGAAGLNAFNQGTERSGGAGSPGLVIVDIFV